MRSTARLKRKLKKVRANAKKLKIKLTYKKNGTYKYKSLKRLLNDIKKKKGCKRCIRCKRCKKCKRCVRCKRCKKCNCKRRNRFGAFDWNYDWKEMPPPVKKKTAAAADVAKGIWNTNTPEEKKKTWIQRLGKEATEKEWKKWKGDIPVFRGTELAEEYNRLYDENCRIIEAEMKNASPFNAPGASYKNIGITEEPAFGKNRLG